MQDIRYAVSFFIITFLTSIAAPGWSKDEAKLITRHFMYVNLVEGGINLSQDGEYYKNLVVLQYGRHWPKPIGLEVALLDLVRFREDRGVYSWLPFGIYYPIMLKQPRFLQGFVLNLAIRAHLWPRYKQPIQEVNPSEFGTKSFPQFFDLCIEWRGTLHSICLGYRYQTSEFKHESNGWDNGLNMTGLFADLRIGISGTITEVVREEMPPPNPQVILHYQRGLTAFKTEDYYLAAKEFNITLSFDSTYIEALDKLKEIKTKQSDAYMEKGADASLDREVVNSYERAIDYWLKSVAVNPENASIRSQIERTYTKAISELRDKGAPDESTKRLSDQATAWRLISKGLDAFNRNDLSEAKTQIELAIRIDSNYALAYLYLGLIQFRQGDVISAKAQFRRALQLDRGLIIPADAGFRVWEAFCEVKDRL